MSTLTALAKATAVLRGRAEPVALVRHVHVAARPMVFVPLALAGEANAPLGCMVGTDPAAPTLLVVPQPRNRDLRLAFASALGRVLLPYVESFGDTAPRTPEPSPPDEPRAPREPPTDAPQIWVPNGGGIDFVRLLGRSTRFQRGYGPYAVPATVPRLGRWLTYFAERAEHPGSCLLPHLIGALTLHWATGQSMVEDANLATLMAWLDPPPGQSGAEAALAAEDPQSWPPAGPATDPTFDNNVLSPLVAAFNARSVATIATGDVVAIGDDTDPAAAIKSAVRGQIEPTWRLVWRGLDLLRTLPAGTSVATRWGADRQSYGAFVGQLVQGTPPQPRRDSAVAAAQRLHRMERRLAEYDAQRAFDDPLVMAEYRLTGEAFVGDVAWTEPGRIDATGTRRKLRPHIRLTTSDPVMLAPGTVVTSPARPAQRATIVSVVDGEVLLELSGGMGRSLRAAPGSVPDLGERLCYTSVVPGYQPTAMFPSREETPWTHGGPPPEWVPDEDETGLEDLS